jgi:hypothetical protein
VSTRQTSTYTHVCDLCGLTVHNDECHTPLRWGVAQLPSDEEESDLCADCGSALKTVIDSRRALKGQVA